MAEQRNISLDYTPRAWQQQFHIGANRVRFALAIWAFQIGNDWIHVVDFFEFTDIGLTEIFTRLRDGHKEASQ
jgi:hypothetical protein